MDVSEEPVASGPAPDAEEVTDSAVRQEQKSALLEDTLNSPSEILRPTEFSLSTLLLSRRFLFNHESGRLRFSSARSTNDPSELSFGNNCVEEVLRELHNFVRPNEKEWLRQN